MKYKLLIFFFFCLTFFAFSQDKVILVEYGTTINDDNGFFTNDKIFGEPFIKAMNEAKNLNFGLIINPEGAKFFDKSDINLEIENSNMGLAKTFSNYMGIVYSFDDRVLMQSKLLGDNIYTKEEIKKDWIITNESKLIDNYLCYKATSVNRITNKAGQFNFPITAWFCPTIPYQYGPNGYGNLPGLILEIQIRNVTYFMKKIDFYSKLNFNKNFLKKAIIISKEEQDKRLDEFNGFDKLKIKN